MSFPTKYHTLDSVEPFMCLLIDFTLHFSFQMIFLNLCLIKYLGKTFLFFSLIIFKSFCSRFDSFPSMNCIYSSKVLGKKSSKYATFLNFLIFQNVTSNVFVFHIFGKQRQRKVILSFHDRCIKRSQRIVYWITKL